MTLRNPSGGFTLIELMVIIVIVAVLLTIGLPAYQNQVMRGHRAAAKAEILELANREQQYLLSNRTYTNDPAEFSYSLPPDVADKYSFSLSTVSASAVPAFQIRFNAIGSQATDGDLTLNSEGVKTPADKWAR
jgi:type IV pilus assembly protein PilE